MLDEHDSDAEIGSLAQKLRERDFLALHQACGGFIQKKHRRPQRERTG